MEKGFEVNSGSCVWRFFKKNLLTRRDRKVYRRDVKVYGGSSAKNGRAENERTDTYVYYEMERCKRLRSMSVEKAFY